jgi:prepilin-type processing-associated H-X9-DG protein
VQSGAPDESVGCPVVRRVSRAAVASLALGLASLLLLFLTGIPAIWVGVNALRAMNAAEDRVRGRRLAWAGIVLGGAGCAAAVVGLLVLVYTTLQVRSQRLACENNLRRIGAAVLNYHTTNNVFPPGALPNAALPPERRLSWLAALPPFLEQKAKDSPRMQILYGELDLSEAWDSGANAAVARSTAPLCRCPAHAFEDPRVAAGNTDYVGLAGVGRDAAELPITDPNAGIFGYDRTVRLDDLKAGASETLLAAETGRDNGPWIAGGPATVRGIDPADVPHVGPGRAFGGLHAGGLNVLFADGSAEFMGNEVSPQFFETLTRLRRDEPAPAAP